MAYIEGIDIVYWRMQMTVVNLRANRVANDSIECAAEQQRVGDLTFHEFVACDLVTRP